MRQLGQLEAAVMQRLWERDAAMSVRDVLADLAPERTLAYTTVMTVLDNLHGKGLVERSKVGRAYHYRAVGTREDHTASLLEDVLAGTPDRGAALLRLVDRLSPDQVADLRDALDRSEDGRA